MGPENVECLRSAPFDLSLVDCPFSVDLPAATLSRPGAQELETHVVTRVDEGQGLGGALEVLVIKIQSLHAARSEQVA